MLMETKESLGSHPLPAKLDFKPKTVIRDKEGHYIRIKGSIQQENLTIVNIYDPNMGATNCVCQIIQY